MVAWAASNESQLAFTQYVVPSRETCSCQWDSSDSDVSGGLISVCISGLLLLTLPLGALRPQCCPHQGSMCKNEEPR